VSLRGFGNLSTLVLLNGRRITNFAFGDESGIGVDLNAIPLAAIERIEVLTDGASAIYGSEAIAGVVNFILRRDFHGGQVDVQRSRPEARGGGGDARQTLTLGSGTLATEGFNLFGAFDHTLQQSLAARDRAFAATGYRPDLGVSGPVVPGSFPANIAAPGGLWLNPAAPKCTTTTVFENGGCFYDSTSQVDLLPRADNLGALLRATVALSGDSQLHGELLASRQQVQYTVAATPINRGFYGSYPAWVIPVDSPFYPTGLGLTGDIVDPFYRTVPLGPRVSRADTHSWRALVGWQGRIGGWDVDTALMQSTTRSNNDLISGNVDSTKLSAAFAAGLVNPFGDSGPVGGAALAATELRGTVRTGRGTTRSGDVRASRELGHWNGGAVLLGLGAEARRESLVSELTALANIGAGFGLGFDGTQQAGQRDAQALFAELALPVLPKLDAQLALRTDHYSDFGTHTSPKIALRWHPVKALVLRASAGTGFRAPSLPELYALQSAPAFDAGEQDPVRCPVTRLDQDCDVIVPNYVGGNPALRPETSRQSSFGMVLEPFADTSITVDWWHLALNRTIGEFDIDSLLHAAPQYQQQFVLRGPPDAGFPNLPGPITGLILTNENLGDQRASGVDVDVRCNWTHAAWGRFKLHLSGSYLASWRQRFDGVENSRILVLPRWQHAIDIDWDRGAWSTTVGQTWRSDYQDENLDVNGNIRRVGPYRIWNAQEQYSGGTHWSLALGVKNLLDTRPPVSNQTAYFQVGYDPSYADPRGRVWYGRATYRWN
jgi:iron complex outermembrane receptor protein